MSDQVIGIQVVVNSIELLLSLEGEDVLISDLKLYISILDISYSFIDLKILRTLPNMIFGNCEVKTC